MSCVDIVVVKYPDGSFKSSPFFIRLNNNPTSTHLVKIFVNRVPHPYNIIDQQHDTFNAKDAFVLVSKHDMRNPVFIPASQYLNRPELEDDPGYEPFTPKQQTSDQNTKNSGMFIELPKKSQPVLTPNTPSSPSTPTTPTAKKSWSERWLDSIERELPPYQELTPPSNFIKELNLQQEINDVVFEVNGERINGRIFLWNYDVQVIITDIDGTITKSDVMGHFMSWIGKDYTHPGISSLFTRFVERGYKVLYLTARPITLFSATKTYIEGIEQSGDRMPTGPIFTAPNKTWNALAREVIIRRPETFKIAILSTLRNLFLHHNPFISGWGNRHTDSTSYTAVGIDPRRSYIVNPKGEITDTHSTIYYSSHAQFEKSLGDALFPAVTQLETNSDTVPDEHETWKKLQVEQTETTDLEEFFDAEEMV